MPPGRGNTQIVKLTGRDAGKAKVVSIEAQSIRSGRSSDIDPASILTMESGDGEAAGTILLSIAPDAPIGPFHGLLRIVTDHPSATELMLKIVGQVQGPVDLQPTRLHLRDSGLQNPQTRFVMLSSTTGEPVRVLEVAVDHPALAASFAEIAPDRTRIEVRLGGTIEAAREEATLSIRTSNESAPLLKVPVTLFPARQVRPAQPARPSGGG